MKTLQNGWHEVTGGPGPRALNSRTWTELYIDKGKPTMIRSTAEDLDRATDDAAQFYGEPLETGDWQPSHQSSRWGKDHPRRKEMITKCFPASELDD